MKQTERSTPNWLLFLFFGSLGCGLVYSIFLHGFLAYDISHSYREASGALYVKPKLAIVPARSSEALAKGEQVYARVCVACHGAYGKYKTGLLGPDLSDKKWLHHQNETKIASLVMKGISAAQSITKQVMPARGGGSLSDQEVWHVVYYLSSRNPSIKKDAKSSQ